MIVSPETVLNIGLGIEQKGIEIYEQIKQEVGNGKVDFLIGQEKEHIKKFKQLFSEDSKLFKSSGSDVGHLDEDYLTSAYVETSIFANLDVSKVDRDNLLDTAISMEKESIQFYGDLLSLAPHGHESQRSLFTDLRREERKHLVTVTELKRSG